MHLSGEAHRPAWIWSGRVQKLIPRVCCMFGCVYFETIETRVTGWRCARTTTDETAQKYICNGKTAIVHLHYHNMRCHGSPALAHCILAHTNDVWAWAQEHELSNAQRSINNGYLFTLWMHRSHDLWPSAWSNTYSGWIQRLWNIQEKNKQPNHVWGWV